MKASISWLKDYVDIKASPDQLAKRLIMAGVHVASVSKTEADAVFEFEITANRNDCLSLIGISREIAALYGVKLKLPATLYEKEKKAAQKNACPIKITIEDKILCPRYSARICRGLHVTDSPKWLKDRLASVGLRTVNNIVDITNFMLMETGQPMHAFDLDKINGGVIIRKAKKGETIKLIDGSSKTLEEGILVIADNAGPAAVAGVMGGALTEVTGSTKNILLESAFFDPVSVRRASRKLGISTDSSYRFERKVDQGMVLPASKRAAGLIKECAGGETGELIDLGLKTVKPAAVRLSTDRTNQILGFDIRASDQKKILSALGFGVRGKAEKLIVSVPGHRRDIIREEDLIEEIIRINGYDNIPETIPSIIGNITVIDKSGLVKKEIRKTLVSFGMDEAITYNLMSENTLDIFTPDKKARALLINPLSLDQAALAGTLLPGMLKCVSHNINRKNKDLSFFEIGKSYQKIAAGKYSEELRLSMAMTGMAEDDWISGRRPVSFYDLKGVIVKLLNSLGIKDILFSHDTAPHYFSVSARISASGIHAGYIGKVGRDTLDRLDINEDVYAAELNIDRIMEKIDLEKRFTPIPRFPSVIRDISLAADEGLNAEKITNLIISVGAPLAKATCLMSVYKGEHIPQGKAGLLYRVVYRDDDKTLTESEVDAKHEAVKKELAAGLGIVFR